MKWNIVYTSGGPKWELTADVLVYILIVDHGDDYFKGYCELKNPSNDDMKRVRKALHNTASVGMTGVAKFKENKEPYFLFANEFFIRFYKVDPNKPAIHRKFMNLRPDLKVRLYKQCVQGILYDDEFKVEVDDDSSLDSLEVLVPMKQAFYDPANDEEVEIKIVHYLEESELHRTSVDEAVNPKMKVEDETLDLGADIDFDSIEDSYNNAVIEVTGYVVDGTPCTSKNKIDWVNLIPFEHKMLAMDRMDTAELS